MTPAIHIVDELIQERAERLIQHPLLWRFIKRVLYPILNYEDTVKLVDEVDGLSGSEIMHYVSRRLDLKMQIQGLEHIPATGAAVVLANHPSGIADGVAVWDALRKRRDDVMIFANRDAIRVAPGLADLIIPVEWVDDKKTHERSKETVKQMVSAFRSKRLIVIFPSGRLAKPTLTGLQERTWMPTAVSLAQRYQCPIIPMHLGGRNSWFFYCMCVLNTELRDMTLFRELLNKRSTEYRVDIAEAISPEQAAGDHKALTIALQEFVSQDMPRGARKFVQPPTNAPDTDTGTVHNG